MGTPNNQALEIDLPALVKAALRRKAWVLASATLGLALGTVYYKLSKRIYSSTVVFASDAGQGKGGRLQQLALLAGSFDLGSESSPYLSHIEKYADSRELSRRMKVKSFGDSTLLQMLVKGEVYRGDTDFAFHKSLTSLYTLKKDADGLFNLEAKTTSPLFSRFLADSLFGELDRLLREKDRQNTNSRLEFVNYLVDKYYEEMKSASDRIRIFQTENLSAGSPALQQKRDFLIMDEKLAQEKYLTAVRQREELRVQIEQRQDHLVVIEPAYVPPYPTSPTRLKSIVPAFALMALLGLIAVAWADRKTWMYKV